MSDTVKICGVAYPVVQRLSPHEADGAARCTVQTLNGVCTVVERSSGWYIVSEFPRKDEPCKPSVPKQRKRS